MDSHLFCDQMSSFWQASSTSLLGWKWLADHVVCNEDIDIWILTYGYWPSGYWPTGYWPNGYWHNGYWYNGYKYYYHSRYQTSMTATLAFKKLCAQSRDVLKAAAASWQESALGRPHVSLRKLQLTQSIRFIMFPNNLLNPQNKNCEKRKQTKVETKYPKFCQLCSHINYFAPAPSSFASCSSPSSS